MPTSDNLDREQAADVLGVHPGNPSFDRTWSRLKAGEFSEGLTLDQKGRVWAAATSDDGVYRVSRSEMGRFRELMALNPTDARRPRRTGFLTVMGREWASEASAQEAFGMPTDEWRPEFLSLVYLHKNGIKTLYKGRHVEVAKLSGQYWIPVEDARWIASTIAERKGVRPEKTPEWISRSEMAEKVKAAFGRDISGIVAGTYRRLEEQAGAGVDRKAGRYQVFAEIRGLRVGEYALRYEMHVHTRSLTEMLCHFGEIYFGIRPRDTRAMLAGPPAPESATEAAVAERQEAEPVAEPVTEPVAQPVAEPSPPIEATEPLPERPMDDGNMGRVVLVHGNKAWAVALGRGCGSGQDAVAFGRDFGSWLGIDPTCREVREEALCRPFVPAPEAANAADFRAAGFNPASLVLRREEGDGETWDAYLSGVRATHAMGGAVSLVSEPVARRELVTAWGKDGLGLAAFVDWDRQMISDIADALEQGRLAMATSEETGPVLVFADRVEENVSLDEILGIVASVQALNPLARFLRAYEEPPQPTVSRTP